MQKKGLFKILSLTCALSLFACNGAQMTQQSTEKFTIKAEDAPDAGQEEKLNVKSFALPASVAGPKPIDENSKITADTTPHLNLVTNPALRKVKMGNIPFPDRGLRNPGGNFSVKTCCGTGALHWGARIQQVTGTNLTPTVYAQHKVNLTQTFPAADTLVYSPTLLPPNNSPVEVSTIYYRPPGSSANMRYFGVWDHTVSSNNWIVYKDMTDTTWQNKYTGNFPDGRFYFVEIRKTSSTTNTWTVRLYNFTTSAWENLTPMPKTFTGGSSFVDGWDFHEPKFDDICPTLLPIKAINIQVNKGAGWYYNTPANGASLLDGSLKCPNWSLSMNNQYYNWSVN